jgi:hypothetical protein
MSKSWFYLGIISSLAILTSSCGGDDKKATTPAPAAAPAAATSPAPAPGAPATPSSTATAPIPGTPATTPGAASIKPVSPDVSAGLIPSTEPENWSRTVSKGRPDPFAVLALQPVEIAIENTTAQQAPVKASPSVANKSQSINPISSQPTTKKSPSINPIATQASTKIATNSPAIKSGVDKPLPKIKISAKLPKAAIVSARQKIKNGSLTSKATPTAESVTSGKGSIPEYKPSTSIIPKSGVNKALPKMTGIATAKSTPVTAIPNSGSTKKIKIVKVTKIASSKKSTVTEVPRKTQIATKPEVVVAKPLQAMAIEISGMIDVAGKTQVIIKLPTESFSRYVEVGERILNGKVLVKRVEGQNSLSPTVVLEEVGVEVARRIGDKSTPATPSAPVTPAIPVTPASAVAAPKP